jgi:hypothetical protein
VVINTGLGPTATLDSATGSGNVTRLVTIDPTNATQMAALQALITAPDTAYINIHTTQFGGGVARSQMFPVVNTVAQAAGGGDWLTAVTVHNSSTTSAVQGIVDFFTSNGAPMPASVVDPNISFWIPAGGSTTISTQNKGFFAGGFAKVFTNGTVTVDARYMYPSFTLNTNTATTVTGRGVSLPVSVGATATTNTGVALIANVAGTLTLSLQNSSGAAIPGGSRTIDVAAGQQITAFVSELMSSVTLSQYTGTLTITTSAGTVSVLALQFDTTITPVTLTALP